MDGVSINNSSNDLEAFISGIGIDIEDDGKPENVCSSVEISYEDVLTN